MNQPSINQPFNREVISRILSKYRQASRLMDSVKLGISITVEPTNPNNPSYIIHIAEDKLDEVLKGLTKKTGDIMTAAEIFRNYIYDVEYEFDVLNPVDHISYPYVVEFCRANSLPMNYVGHVTAVTEEESGGEQGEYIVSLIKEISDIAINEVNTFLAELIDSEEGTAVPLIGIPSVDILIDMQQQYVENPT